MSCAYFDLSEDADCNRANLVDARVKSEYERGYKILLDFLWA